MLRDMEVRILALVQQEITALAASTVLGTPLLAPSPSSPHPTPYAATTADDSESEIEYGEAISSVPGVNVARSSGWKLLSRDPKKVKLPEDPQPAPAPLAPRPVDLRSADELSVSGLQDMLRIKRAASRSSGPQPLTEEEKEMDLADLHRKWKHEDQQRKQEATHFTPYDFRPLGKLTEAQKFLSRPEVRRVIRERRTERWVQEMKAKGVPLHECEVCHEIASDKHQCLATRWMTEGSYGVNKGLVITQQGPSVRLRAAQIIDQAKLEKEHAEITALKQQIEERTRRIQAALESPISQDVEMATTSSQNASSSSALPKINVFPPDSSIPPPPSV